MNEKLLSDGVRLYITDSSSRDPYLSLLANEVDHPTIGKLYYVRFLNRPLNLKHSLFGFTKDGYLGLFDNSKLSDKPEGLYEFISSKVVLSPNVISLIQEHPKWGSTIKKILKNHRIPIPVILPETKDGWDNYLAGVEHYPSNSVYSALESIRKRGITRIKDLTIRANPKKTYEVTFFFDKPYRERFLWKTEVQATSLDFGIASFYEILVNLAKENIQKFKCSGDLVDSGKTPIQMLDYKEVTNDI
jgi:hypothetical protein